nr:uncharacterized protein LOC109407706 [Aedes albopictus]
MQIFTLVFGMCVVGSSFAHLTQKQHETIKDIAIVCARELEITLDDAFLQPGIYEGVLFKDDRKNKQFIACFLTKMGAVSADGKILGDKLLEFMTEDHDDSSLKSTIEKCVAVEGDTLEDRAYNFHKCFWEERMDEL